MDRKKVYDVIDTEREYQDLLGSDRIDGHTRSVGEYLVMLHHYLREADKAWTCNAGDNSALHVVRKIAGIAVHCMEDHGALRRKPPVG